MEKQGRKMEKQGVDVWRSRGWTFGGQSEQGGEEEMHERPGWAAVSQKRYTVH